MTAPYHVGFVVPDLDAAMRDLTAVSGCEWFVLGEHPDGVRVAFTRGEPPHVELIEGRPGGPWDCGGTARFDHLAFWTPSVSGSSERLAAAGLPLDQGCPSAEPFVLHRIESLGARVELADAATQHHFRAAVGSGPAPMPVLDEPDGTVPPAG